MRPVWRFRRALKERTHSATDLNLLLALTTSGPTDDAPATPTSPGPTFREMVRARIYATLAGNENQNDHDIFRSDPICKFVAHRSTGSVYCGKCLPATTSAKSCRPPRHNP